MKVRASRNAHAVDADNELVCEMTPWQRQDLPGMTWARVHPSQRCRVCHLIVDGHGQEFGVAVARIV